MTTFEQLDVGQSFDWIDDANPSRVSFWHRCVKTSARTYRSYENGHTYTVGTIKAQVFHPGVPMPIHASKPIEEA